MDEKTTPADVMVVDRDHAALSQRTEHTLNGEMFGTATTFLNASSIDRSTVLVAVAAYDRFGDFNGERSITLTANGARQFAEHLMSLAEHIEKG